MRKPREPKRKRIKVTYELSPDEDSPRDVFDFFSSKGIDPKDVKLEELTHYEDLVGVQFYYFRDETEEEYQSRYRRYRKRQEKWKELQSYES